MTGDALLALQFAIDPLLHVLVVRLAIGAVINLIAIPIDNASANPARSFAPAFLTAFFASDQWGLQPAWPFLAAPIVGGILAAVVAGALRERAAAA